MEMELSWKPGIVCMTGKGLSLFITWKWSGFFKYICKYNMYTTGELNTTFWIPSPTNEISTQDPLSDVSQGVGGPDPPPPPLEICQRWGFVWMCAGKERGSKGYFYLIIIILFGLASLACIIHRVNVLKILITSKFPSNSPRSSNTHPRLSWKGISILFCLKLHDFTQFKPKYFFGSTPNPPPPNYDNTNTFYNTKTTMSNVFW